MSNESTSYKKLFEIKQDDWIEACCEIDQLKAKIAIAIEVLEPLLQNPTGYDVLRARELFEKLQRHRPGFILQ